MKTVLITGGTGLIGKALTQKLLQLQYNVIVLTRKQVSDNKEKNVSYALWNVEKQEIDKSAIESCDYIVHLAGANVADGRWTDKRKKQIVDSRVKSGKLLVKALASTNNKVKAVISASAIGWYGPDKNINKPFTENDPADSAFLGTTCKLWEEAIKPVSDLNIRLVTLRTGIVLSTNGGAYTEFKKPTNFFMATILGNGKQVVSWIHTDDLVNMYIYAIENKNINGVYNAVAPNPITNKQLILKIAKTKPFFIPVNVPSFALKLALGEMSIEVLKSATVSSKKIEAAGFSFNYLDIETAIKNLEGN